MLVYKTWKDKAQYKRGLSCISCQMKGRTIIWYISVSMYYCNFNSIISLIMLWTCRNSRQWSCARRSKLKSVEACDAAAVIYMLHATTGVIILTIIGTQTFAMLAFYFLYSHNKSKTEFSNWNMKTWVCNKNRSTTLAINSNW